MAPSSHALPVIPLETFLTNTTSKEALEACETVAQELRHKGILIVRDPRVSEADNAAFLDLLERYFARDECDRMRDVRGDIGYQVGATPAGVEMPRCATDEDCLKRIDDIPEEENKPQVRRFFFSLFLSLSSSLSFTSCSYSLSLSLSLSLRFFLSFHSRNTYACAYVHISWYNRKRCIYSLLVCMIASPLVPLVCVIVSCEPRKTEHVFNSINRSIE